jgi:hypothetical protein
MDDIYNSISNDLYNNVIPVKWLMYNINYTIGDNKNNDSVPNIIVLNEICDNTLIKILNFDWDDFKKFKLKLKSKDITEKDKELYEFYLDVKNYFFQGIIELKEVAKENKDVILKDNIKRDKSRYVSFPKIKKMLIQKHLHTLQTRIYNLNVLPICAFI